MKTKFLILLLTTYLFLSCKEDDNPFTLPNATQTGANTAGCYIDGDLYVLKNANTSDAWIGSSRTIDLNYKYDERSKLWHIYIYIKMEGNMTDKKKSISFFLTSREKFTVKNYKLMKHVENNVSNSAYLFGVNKTEDNAGEIILTKIENNKEHNSIAGTFNFNIKDNTEKIVKVTNGRFDLKIPKK